jgi:hypothetical protein
MRATLNFAHKIYNDPKTGNRSIWNTNQFYDSKAYKEGERFNLFKSANQGIAGGKWLLPAWDSREFAQRAEKHELSRLFNRAGET